MRRCATQHVVLEVLEVLSFLSETAVPYVLMGLGALILMLSLMERRVAAVLGVLFLILGAGISMAPDLIPPLERSPSPAMNPSPTHLASRHSEPVVSPPAHLARSRTPQAPTPTGPERDQAGCTARFTDLELDLAAASLDTVGDFLYDGFLTNLMPSVELLPCATRHFSSRPLTPRAVAASGGRTQAAVLRVLAGGGFAGLERTYGSECSRTPSKGEVPLVRVRVLRFDSVAAGAAWDALPWKVWADALQVTEMRRRRTAWFHGSCGDAPAALFWQELRGGNVVIGVTLYTATENFADRMLEDYSQVLMEDIFQKLPIKD